MGAHGEMKFCHLCWLQTVSMLSSGLQHTCGRSTTTAKGAFPSRSWLLYSQIDCFQVNDVGASGNESNAEALCESAYGCNLGPGTWPKPLRLTWWVHTVDASFRDPSTDTWILGTSGEYLSNMRKKHVSTTARTGGLPWSHQRWAGHDMSRPCSSSPGWAFRARPHSVSWQQDCGQTYQPAIAISKRDNTVSYFADLFCGWTQAWR